MDNTSHLNLNGHLLQIFLAIYDCNSVSKAAELFDLNQSSVSYSLEKLRECLDDPLFVKAGRGITPTDRAVMLVPRIRAQLAGLEGLVSNETYSPRQETSRITIASNITEMLPQFERVYRAMSKIAPDMPVRLLEMGSRQNITRLLESGVADLVVAVKLEKYPAMLAAQTIASSEFACFYDPRMRGPVETIEEYYEANHAALDFGGKVTSQVDHFLHTQPGVRKKLLQVPNVQALAQLASGTDLVITMREDFKDTVLSDFDHCKPPFPMDDLEFDMIWHRRAEHSGRNVWLRNLAMTFMSEGINP